MLRPALFLAAQVTLLATVPPLNTATTPEGVPYGWVGDRPTKPAPTVIFLGGAIRDNLTQPHYLEGVDGLGRKVWCVTIDVPGDGNETVPGEPGGMSTWRHRLEKNDAFLTAFSRRVSTVLDHWIAQNYTDPSRIGLFGTSRGGFIAFHLAAGDSRIRQVAAFAPVTDLGALTEFAGMQGDSRVRNLAATRLADPLHDRGIWLIIGTTDFRVGTRDTILFADRLIEAAIAHGRKPDVELHLEPSEGHRVPLRSYARAAEWMLRQFDVK